MPSKGKKTLSNAQVKPESSSEDAVCFIHLGEKPLNRSGWDQSRHLVGECITFLKASPQDRFKKAKINGDCCISCLTKGCPTGVKGKCLNKGWALLCLQYKDKEVIMGLSQPGWKAKNVLLCEEHKQCVDVERWIELFPFTVEGRGYVPTWRSTPFPNKSSKTSEEYLRASFTKSPRPMESEDRKDTTVETEEGGQRWQSSLLSFLDKVKGRRKADREAIENARITIIVL